MVSIEESVTRAEMCLEHYRQWTANPSATTPELLANLLADCAIFAQQQGINFASSIKRATQTAQSLTDPKRRTNANATYHELKAAILRRGEPQWRIAQILGISEPSLSKYMRGYGKLPQQTVQALQQLLGVPL